jgi:hypothetical protein
VTGSRGRKETKSAKLSRLSAESLGSKRENARRKKIISPPPIVAFNLLLFQSARVSNFVFRRAPSCNLGRKSINVINPKKQQNLRLTRAKENGEKDINNESNQNKRPEASRARMDD